MGILLLDPHPWFVASSLLLLCADVSNLCVSLASCLFIPPGAAKDSAASVALRIFPSSMAKCPRCWVYSAPREDTLCVRCERVVREVESLA